MLVKSSSGKTSMLGRASWINTSMTWLGRSVNMNDENNGHAKEKDDDKVEEALPPQSEESGPKSLFVQDESRERDEFHDAVCESTPLSNGEDDGTLRVQPSEELDEILACINAIKRRKKSCSVSFGNCN